MLKYPCLVLDHDDTAVNSTATVHYPAFVAYMKEHHPDRILTLDECEPFKYLNGDLADISLPPYAR